MEEYQKEYADFIKQYKRGATSAEEVGELIVRLAQYFSNKNTLMGVRYDNLNKKTAEFVQADDEQTGKPISVTKAEVLVRATEESNQFEIARRDVQNIEQMINALKSLQKGLMNEYSHMSGV